MSVHEDTLQGLQEALDYVKGDTTKGWSNFVTTDTDLEAIEKQLPQDNKEAVNDELSKTDNQ